MLCKSSRISARTKSAFAALLVSVFAPAAVAGTHDRDNSTPTGYSWYYGASSSTIQSSRNAGFRIVSLDVESVSPLRFNAALVRNSGSYARSGREWWWGTPSFIATKLSGKRITALTPYVQNNQLRLSVALIDNTGSNQKGYAYYWGTLSYIMTQVGSFGGRIVDLDSYVIGSTRYYTALAIKNTGSDQKGWWVYTNATPSFIAGRLAANRARIIDLGDAGTGRYHCVMVRDTKRYWWYYNVTATTVADKLGQNGARLISLNRQGSRFNAVMMNNVNALTTKVGDIIRKVPGVSGIYMKQVGGSSLVSLNAGRQYEPASSLKTLHHVHAMRQVALRRLTLATRIRSYQGSRTACPNANFPTTQEALEPILRDMMRVSHNTKTFSVERWFGRSNLQATATALGMTRTSLNHSIGCGTPANRFTLVDAGKLFEAVATGYLGSHKEDFYRLMSRSKLSSLVTAEASKLAIPSDVRTSFLSYVDHVSKGGSYRVASRDHRSHVGWLKLPFCTRSGVATREYVYGNWFNDVPNYTSEHSALSAQARDCMLSEYIRQALLTWKNSEVTGSVTPYGIGCNGSNGRVSHSQTSGRPRIGSTLFYRLSNGPKSGIAVLFLGSSKTFWGRIPLPLNLTGAGAPGCRIYTALTFSFPVATSSNGTASRPLGIPDDKGLVGKRLFTQYMGVDGRANQLGLTFSNGLDVLIGGWPK